MRAARRPLLGSGVARLAPAYQPCRPTETVLYRVVHETLETFLAHARETYASALPRYVEREFRSYLRCGVFAHGFTRCHCDACGSDLLVGLLLLPWARDPDDDVAWSVAADDE